VFHALGAFGFPADRATLLPDIDDLATLALLPETSGQPVERQGGVLRIEQDRPAAVRDALVVAAPGVERQNPVAI
jgi:hypothetical protein